MGSASSNFLGGIVVELANIVEEFFALIIIKPADLEGMIAFHAAAGIVVDGFAGPAEQPGGMVIIAQDQVPIRFGAGQHDADGHLIDGAAGQRVGTAERLRTEDDMDTKGTTLANQTIQKQCCFLR